jgi:hypothetical protein
MVLLLEKKLILPLEMPPDHATGPDGFNGFFFKKCWHLISEDFYRFCECFYNGNINLSCINGSLIVLIPKCDNPLSPNDFRLISLLNLSLKLLTKILANRLQQVILFVVHQNQYGFIRGRNIKIAWHGHFNFSIFVTIAKKRLSLLN